MHYRCVFIRVMSSNLLEAIYDHKKRIYDYLQVYIRLSKIHVSKSPTLWKCPYCKTSHPLLCALSHCIISPHSVCGNKRRSSSLMGCGFHLPEQSPTKISLNVNNRPPRITAHSVKTLKAFLQAVRYGRSRYLCF